jgi:hypothetical protein
VLTLGPQRPISYHQTLDSGIASRGSFNRAHEIQRPLLGNELAREHENYRILMQTVFLSQLRTPQLKALCFELKLSIVDGMRHRKNPLWARTVMQKVLSRPLADC